MYCSQTGVANSLLPSGTMPAGSNFTIAGTISSESVLRTITGAIYNLANPAEPVQTVTVYPHAREYKLTGFFTKKLIFSTLSEGDYEIAISAVDSSGANIEVVRSPFSVGPDEIPPQTEEPAEDKGSSQTMLEFHFAGQGHRRETVTAAAKPAAPLSVRFGKWFYEHWSLRTVLRTATKIGCKCALERTPLFRIVSKAFCKLEIGYLTLHLQTVVPAAEPEE